MMSQPSGPVLRREAQAPDHVVIKRIEERGGDACTVLGEGVRGVGIRDHGWRATSGPH